MLGITLAYTREHLMQHYDVRVRSYFVHRGKLPAVYGGPSFLVNFLSLTTMVYQLVIEISPFWHNWKEGINILACHPRRARQKKIYIKLPS